MASVAGDVAGDVVEESSLAGIPASVSLSAFLFLSPTPRVPDFTSLRDSAAQGSATSAI